MIVDALIAIGIGYFLGSIPFGLLLTRFAGLGDIRDIGSGNIGATNVLRTGNKWLAIATLLLDAGKAALAVVIVRMIFPDVPYIASISATAGMFAFIGHLFPVWLGFKGGKGVATYIGALLVINLTAGLVFCGMWLFFAYAFRISSLAALSAAGAAPFVAFIFSGFELAGITLIMSLLLFYKHIANIKRLGAGTEPSFDKKKEK